MTLTTTSYVERVLIVLNSDGTLKGAHQETMSEIKDGATLIAATMLPAVGLNAQTLASILPDQASLAAQVQSLTEQLATANAAKSTAEARVADLEAQIAGQG